MPRDGSGIYTQPFPDVAPATTIESAVYNGFVADVVIDLNAARPIIAGGTGATSASGALFNLSGETAAYAVTNFDSHVWYPGSFRAAGTATGGPVAGHAFSGIVHINEALANPPTNANVTVEARDLTDGKKYFRIKTAGVWGAWVVDATAADVAAKVAKAGDTMTGLLILSGDAVDPLGAATKQQAVMKAGDTMTGALTLAPASGNANLLIYGATSGDSANIYGGINGFPRWRMNFNVNAAGDFRMNACDDAGATSFISLTGVRSSGLFTVAGNPTAALGIATKQYVDAGDAAIIAAGSRMLFNQTVAPTGWTKELSGLYNDRALRVTTTTVGAGGSVAFSTLFARVAVDSGTLTVSQLANHNHQPTSRSGAAGTDTGNGFTNGGVDTSGPVTGSTGGNLGHTHGLDLRVLYNDVIIATKN